MVRARAAVCSRVHTSPFGVCPFGSTSLRSVQPSAHSVSLNSAALHLAFLRSQPRYTRLNATSFLGVIAHSRSFGRGYLRSFLAPIAHVQSSLPFASTSRSFGRILPRSSVGLASLRSAQSASFFGTIAFALVILKFFPLSLLRSVGRHYFFEIAD